MQFTTGIQKKNREITSWLVRDGKRKLPKCFSYVNLDWNCRLESATISWTLDSDVKKLYVFIFCSWLNFNNLNIDNYYTQKAVWFKGMVHLSKDFLDKWVFPFPIAHFRLVFSAGLELRRFLLGWCIPGWNIWREQQRSSRKFSSRKEVEERENHGVSSSERCWQVWAVPSIRAELLPWLWTTAAPRSTHTPGWGTIKRSQADQTWSPNSSWGAP